MPPVAKPCCISLTTDFGLTDHYAGTMKGVIAGICPQALVIDVTHGVPAHRVTDGAYLIGQAWRYFPPGSIHVVVVDPGVGSARRAILLEAEGHRFIAPDNGVLAMVMIAVQNPLVRWINATEYFLANVSQTFHGRDIFASVAAHVAAGLDTSKLGPLIEDYVCPAAVRPQLQARGWKGEVLHVDTFGNLITNFAARDFWRVADGSFELSVGDRLISTYARSYSESPAGELFVIAGSSGFLEISCARSSAASLLGIGSGEAIELRFPGFDFGGPEKA